MVMQVVQQSCAQVFLQLNQKSFKFLSFLIKSIAIKPASIHKDLTILASTDGKRFIMHTGGGRDRNANTGRD